MMSSTDTTSDDLIRRGLEASRIESVDEALRLFGLAAQAAPHDAMPHFLAGVELAQAGRIDEAEAALARAVLLARNSRWPAFSSGCCSSPAAGSPWR